MPSSDLDPDAGMASVVDGDRTKTLTKQDDRFRATDQQLTSEDHPSASSQSSPAAAGEVSSTNVSSKTAAAPESKPMTTTSSSSSSAPSTKAPNANDTTGLSPYGTRSRQRNGNARPNYAEDREFDMDYEWASTKRGPTSGAHVESGDHEKRTGASTRRSSASMSGSGNAKAFSSSAPAASKDYIPGTSTFSVHSENPQPQTRKRKAYGSSANSSAQAGSHAPTRKGSLAAMSAGSAGESNMVSFETCQGYLKHGKLKADDGTMYGVNDYVYLVCEPPGDPYYLARIMEFLHPNNDRSLPVDSLRINWVYRPRDIPRKVNETRLVFATMHSDTCPLTSLRGKCQVLHRNDVEDLEEYRKTKDCFWFDKMFDRYSHRYYEVIPTSQVINVPERVKKVLDERWRFIVVEVGRGKELTSAIKTCKRCTGYCASNDSVDCAMCKNTYHMNCVRPPLQKKPARGFAWSCGPCSRRQERKLEARNTPLVGEKALEGDDEEFMDEEEDENGLVLNPTGGSSPSNSDTQDSGLRPATTEQLAQAKLWPYRYLGVHCRVEDALDYDDRIYPRAASRLGPKHQANVTVWHGRPVELVKPKEIKRKYMKGNAYKKDIKPSKESVAAMEADKLAREKRPKWVVDEPPGYVRRGEDLPNNSSANTAKLRFRLPEVGEVSSRGQETSKADIHNMSPEQQEQLIDEYMARAKKLAGALGTKEYATDFLDKALELLYTNDFMPEPALEQLRHIDRRKVAEAPDFNKEELKRFEEGITKYGSQLWDTTKHVGKSRKHGDIVRFYYVWKKWDRGKEIWGSYEGRKSKKQVKPMDTKLMDDVADDYDDSAFDNEKAAERKRGFECKFCSTRKSRQWRRAPGTAPWTTVLAEPSSKSSKEKAVHLMVALCQRCAGLWRKYAITWENIEDVNKKANQGGGKAWKRKIDEELLTELKSANEASSVGLSGTAAAAAASVGADVPQTLVTQSEYEFSRKKQKTTSEEPPKKKIVEKAPEPPLIPEEPKRKTHPCAVCGEMEPVGEQHLCCRICRLTVHRNCYGVTECRSVDRWTCDMCLNDSTSQLSTTYDCVLCSVRQGQTEYELMEPPKVSHKKKTDREREKERQEKEMVIEATEDYRRKQKEMGRPVDPREPLKRTAGNNWVHIVCAVWIPEIKFDDAKALEPSEGIGLIPTARYEQVCKLCKTSSGACVTCHQCPATFHVACAQQYGYTLGFDITPVKSSRRDVINTVTLGSEAGNAAAVVYCREHSVKSIVHPMSEPVQDSDLNALQLYVRNYKQADHSLTGTVRKAAIINSSTRANTQVNNSTTARRSSVSNGSTSGTAQASRSVRVSPATITVKSEEVDEDGDRIVHLSDTVVAEPSERECSNCGCNTSPKWHRVQTTPGTNIKSSPKLLLDTAASNGHAQLDRAQFRDSSASRKLAPHLEPTMGSNVPQNDDGLQIINAVTTEAIGQSLPRGVANGAHADNDLDAPATFLCHKCFLRKGREPTPCRATVGHSEDSRGAVQDLTVPMASPVPLSSNLGASEPRYNNWPAPPTVYTAAGVSHSPEPSVGSGIQVQYAPVPAHFYGNGYATPHSHHLGTTSNHLNGTASPYQLPRSNIGHMESMPFNAPGQHHSSPPYEYALPSTNRPRSPPVPERPIHTPHGVPRAAENPFLVPHQAHSSPRQAQPRNHGSPPSRIGERPETPTEGIGRNGGWPGSDVMMNGASASPSLRNLLH